MDESFIVVAVITTMGGLIGLLLLDRNWFRRERFKAEMNFSKKENDLKFKKLARDMGLSPPSKQPISNPGLSETASSLLPLLSKLAPEQIADIAGMLTGNKPDREREDDDPDNPFGGLDGLIEFATKNPALVKGFLDKIGDKNEGGQDLI